MKTIAFLAVVLLLTGCSNTSRTTKTPEVKLKAFLAKSDVLLTRRFFGSESFSLPVPPDDVLQYVTTKWSPGSVEIEPITAEDANNKRNKVKGIRVDISQNYWTLYADGVTKETGGKETGTAFLDADELKDLDAAVAYMQSTSKSWLQKRPDVQTEITFASKDGFKATLGWDKAPVIILNVENASVELDANRVVMLKKNVEKAISTLDAN